MRIFVTGGAGFIGSHLTERLLEEGHDVRVLDNLRTGRRESLPDHENLVFELGSVADRTLVERSLADFNPRLVVHAAAAYKNPDDWEEDVRTNALGTANIVQAAQRCRVARLIYFQTALCYGLKPLEHPITLSHPLQPERSSYAISKTAGEHYIRSSGLDFVSFRLANIVGPRNLSGPVPTFYDRLSRRKPCFVTDTRRDFVYVQDLVDLVVKAVHGEGAPGVYHASTGSDYAIKDVFDAVVAAMGITLEREVEVRPAAGDDAPSILLDPSRTREVFGWEASTPLEVTIGRAVEWYQRHDIGETYTHLRHEESDSST